MIQLPGYILSRSLYYKAYPGHHGDDILPQNPNKTLELEKSSLEVAPTSLATFPVTSSFDL